MSLYISTLGYRWRGLYSAHLNYQKGDLVRKGDHAEVFTGTTFAPFALGQQQLTQRGQLLAGHPILPGAPDMQLHMSASGELEYRFTQDRNATRAVALMNLDNRGDTGGGKTQYHGMAIMTDGSVRAWGDERQGHLGNGVNSDRARTKPVPVGFPPDTPPIVSLYKGYKSTYAIDADGMLWSWGQNNHGQLGLGHTTDTAVPNKVNGRGDLPADRKIIKVAVGDCGYYGYKAAILIDELGVCYWVGHQRYYAGGVGDNNQQNAPKVITRSLETPMIDAWVLGHYHMGSFLLDANGVLYMAGEQNTISRLQNNDNPNVMHEPWPPSFSNPVKAVRGEESDYHVDAGSQYYRNYMIIHQNGSISTWGHNNYSSHVPGAESWIATLDPRISNVVDGYCSAGHYDQCVVLRGDGSVWGIGYNGYNSLVAPGDRNSWHNLASSSSLISNITKIQGGGWMHAKMGAGLRTDGTVVKWGRNQSGAAGHGFADNNYPSNVALVNKRIVDFQLYGQWGHDYDNASLLLLADDGTVYSCGYNGYAALGNDDDHEAMFTPSPVLF